MSFSSTNIGLQGKAINGKNFDKKFAFVLEELFTNLLNGDKCSGLFIVEVGNIDDPCESVRKMH